jgi:hypothetical protein
VLDEFSSSHSTNLRGQSRCPRNAQGQNENSAMTNPTPDPVPAPAPAPVVLVTSKVWWQSKTVWSGIVAVAVELYNVFASSYSLPAIPSYVFAVLGGLGIYGRVTATTVIK